MYAWVTILWRKAVILSDRSRCAAEKPWCEFNIMICPIRKIAQDHNGSIFQPPVRQSTSFVLGPKINTKKHTVFSIENWFEFCFWTWMTVRQKTDNRKWGSQKMLDTKNHQKWPPIEAYQNHGRGSLLFLKKIGYSRRHNAAFFVATIRPMS